MPFRLKLDERLLSRLKHTDEKHTLIKTSLYDVVKTALEKDDFENRDLLKERTLDRILED